MRYASGKLATSLLLITCLLVIGSGAAIAAALTFDDTAANDTITISANDFEGGLAVNGIFIQQGLNNPQSVIYPESAPVNFFGLWFTPGQTPQSGTRTVYLVESTDPTLVSDILIYSWDIVPSGGSEIQGSFQSDVNDDLGSLPAGTDPANVFVENGGPVVFSLPFLTGQVVSDLDASVPEPSSLALLALGLMCATVARGRKSR